MAVVRIELDGLDRLVAAAGDEAGDRIVHGLADTLRRLASDTDHIARLGRRGFGVIMPATTDVAASSYVQRVGLACEPWLESSDLAIRPVIGWATTSDHRDLVDAELAAMHRMRRMRRMRGRIGG